MSAKAKTTKKFFSRETTISETINSSPKKVWALLVNSEGYKAWNSTIISIEGAIELGGTIKLKSVLDPKRTFKLKIKQFSPERILVWGDPMGRRTYTLSESSSSKTEFVMTEKIGGPFFPLFASKIPPFDHNFEKFVSDLKKAAEK